MTDDEAAYIEAKGWKASVVPEPSIIHHFANFCASSSDCGFEVAALIQPDPGKVSVRALVPREGIICNHRHDKPLFVLGMVA
jgi:hypothetical protein